MFLRCQTLSLSVSMALFLQTSALPQLPNPPVFAAMQDSIPPYPLTPKNPGQLKCDQLAAPPDDPQKVGAGVPFGQIKVNEALAVCQQASAGEAWRARYFFLYGRVLEAAQKESEAVKQYKLAAQYIYPQAAFRLGRLYETGQGVVKNWEEAAKWYTKATYSGVADGNAAIAEHFIQSNPPDYGEAVKWAQAAVQGGSGWGSLDLAWLYQFGKGVPKDPAMAATLYEQAAVKGFIDAMYRLGIMIEDGEGLIKDYGTAGMWLYQAGTRGHPQAQGELGHMFYYGPGTKQDYKTAFAWYLPAAQAGIVTAQKSVASMYAQGQGVPHNDSEAFTWYFKAADQNDELSMYRVGVLLQEGRGVNKNLAEAMKWFKKAAEKGYAPAQSSLGYSYMQGLGVAKDYRQAAEWLGKAAEQGDDIAQLNLGQLYEHGWGVKQDLHRARSLYEKAAKSSVPEIANRAKQLGQLTEPDAKAQAQSQTDSSADAFMAIIGPALAIQLLNTMMSASGRHEDLANPPKVYGSTSIDKNFSRAPSTPALPRCRQVPGLADSATTTPPNSLPSGDPTHLECN